MTLDNMTGITKGSYTGFCKSQLITCNRVKECNGVCPFEDALKHADKMQTMNEQHIVDHDRDWIIGCLEHDGFIHTDRFDKANQIIHDALSADTSSDLISRADAVNTLETEKRCTDRAEDVSGLTLAKFLISALPSAELPKGDLISRADAVRWVKTECNPYGKPTLDYDSGLKFIEHLKKMPSELPSTEAEWIPCSERLPDAEYGEGDSMLCCTESGLMYILYWNGGNWCASTGEPYHWVNHKTGWHDKVIAWMPLPTPYKGGDTE